MMPKILAVATTVVLAASVAACGDSGATDSGSNTKPRTDTTSTPPAEATSTNPAPAAGAGLTVKMSEFAFDPKDAMAEAGKVTITAPNEGQVSHELVILKTDADPAHLPMDGKEVDESTSVGEIADVAAGATKKTTLKLTPGKYAMVCALPGHYEAGMYGSLTVK